MKANHNNFHHDTRLALLEQSISHINETMARFEKHFDSIDKNFDFLSKEMKEGFIRLDNDVKSNFKWTMTTLISLFVLSGILPIFTHWLSKLIS